MLVTKQTLAQEEAMSSYKHFTLEERKYLQELLAEGKSLRRIAAILERSPSSISREIKRNRAQYAPKHKPDNKYRYNHWRAQTLYIMRRRKQRRQDLKPGTPEWEFIVSGLRRYWSPEVICGRWSLEHPDRKKLCVSTIYRYIKQRRFPDITQKTHLRRRGKKKQTRNANYNSIQPERIIPQWPDEIKTRSRIGDWEGDTVYGGVGKGLLATMVDRKSRYLCAGLLGSRNADETADLVEHIMTGLPVRSISFDNGAEFAQFKRLENRLQAPVFFAEPHKPWQRGSNENTNGLLRFFFPKGFDFHSLSQDDLDAVLELVNKRPRKCLNWRSPFEIFWGVALA